MKLSSLVPASMFVASLVACGGPPATAPDRPSRGANVCDPKSHDRPFVVAWSGMELATFEAVASTDTVFVSYRGCDLRIVDTCRSESARGEHGVYLPVEWNRESVAELDIPNETALYAKLPIGVPAFGARVKAGESFLVRYLVAGVRNATRSKIRRAEIASRPECKDVTHFVSSYHLGAFALRRARVGNDGTLSAGATERAGGDFDTCRSTYARDLSRCQAPIRVALRPVDDE